MKPFRGRPSTLLRSALAMLLLCAQLLAGMHALGHIEDLAAAPHVASTVEADGNLPAAERHEFCLLCLAAADLAAALPSTPTLALVVPALSRLSPELRPVCISARPPQPQSRGPPLSPA